MRKSVLVIGPVCSPFCFFAEGGGRHKEGEFFSFFSREPGTHPARKQPDGEEEVTHLDRPQDGLPGQVEPRLVKLDVDAREPVLDVLEPLARDGVDAEHLFRKVLEDHGHVKVLEVEADALEVDDLDLFGFVLFSWWWVFVGFGRWVWIGF